MNALANRYESWTAGEDEYLRQHWATTDLITLSAAMGRTHRAVEEHARLIGLRPPVAGVWTQERVDLLLSLHHEGLSAREICNAIPGTTRNAIIGKIHRLGIGRGRPSAPAKAPRVTKPRAVKIVGGTVFDAPVPREPVVKIATDKAFSALLGTEPRPWTQREAGMCAWPIDGLGEEMHSCCAKASDGAPYCAPHMHLRTDQTRRKPNAKDLVRGLRSQLAA